MTVIYKIKFEDGGLTITRTTGQPVAPAASANVSACYELGASFPERAPGGNAKAGSGSGNGSATGPGSGGNPRTGSG